MSRAYHRTQGMGRWPGAGAKRDWPLHLARTYVEGADPDDVLWSNLPRTVGDLATLRGAEAIGADLLAAQAGIDAALAAFPAFAAVAEAAGQALGAVRRARAVCPPGLEGELRHRLDAKEVQLGHVMRHALGIDARAVVAKTYLQPGDETALVIEEGGAPATLDLPEGWHAGEGMLSLGTEAAPSDPYRAAYDPADPPPPALALAVTAAGETARVRLPFTPEPVVLPAAIAAVEPNALVYNLARPGPLALRLSEGAWLDVPEGWAAAPSGDGLILTPSEGVAPGLYPLPVSVDGALASTVHRIPYPHISPTAFADPAEARVGVLDVNVPPVRVGYLGAGNDRVDHWLRAMGAEVQGLGVDALASDATLAALDTIVIGIFALRFRPGLAAAMPRLHRWVEAGGTLVTLYHRPWDNWDADRTPLR
ncbi:MAG: PIG-L family deacetylase, partial [Pseudomonadota bacterium]